jgi:VanZ family protein|tara:strand:+ start:896 stop:1273 length:378 start_codon:yes stop_codon:yes gene_type:complete
MSKGISQRFAALLFFGDLALMTILALKPMQAMGDITHVDKALHFSAYLVLAGLAFLFAQRYKPFLGWCVALAVYGAVIECIQSFMPGRFMSFADFIANISGIAVTILLVKIYLSKKTQSLPSETL